ncbi:AI-2E family transporter [Geodermatophilus sp. SYSU D00758]
MRDTDRTAREAPVTRPGDTDPGVAGPGGTDHGPGPGEQSPDGAAREPADARPLTRALATLPAGARATGVWCLWALVVGTVAYFALQVAVLLGSVVLTVLAALLVTALLRPVVSWLDRHGLPRLAATWLVLLAFLALVGAVVWWLEQRIRSQLSALGPTLAQGLDRIRTFLTDTVGLSEQQVGEVFDGLIAQVTPGSTGGGSGPPGGLLGGGMVVTGVTTAVAFLTAVVLALFTAFWLAYDGEDVCRHALRIVPAPRREGVEAAGRRAWSALGGFLRGTTLVALIDAVGIGIALVVIGVPLPFALALLTFLGAYVPIVGAFVAGIAAVVVAFASGGLTDALLVLAAVVVVQQVEGNLLQPLIMRRVIYLHPLATVYALTVFGLLYGLAGAILAVPVTAVVYAIGVAVADRAHESAARRRRGWLRRRQPAGATASGAGRG